MDIWPIATAMKTDLRLFFTSLITDLRLLFTNLNRLCDAIMWPMLLMDLHTGCVGVVDLWVPRSIIVIWKFCLPVYEKYKYTT